MKNWKEVFGVHPTKMENAYTLTVDYLHVIYEGSSAREFRIDKIRSPIEEITMTEEEVAEQIEKAFSTLTHVVENDQIAILRGQTDVATRSRRGSANTNYGNYWFYNGSHITDRPILVMGHEGKYKVILHPDFDNYGFITK
jgi:hypothetical protein